MWKNIIIEYIDCFLHCVLFFSGSTEDFKRLSVLQNNFLPCDLSLPHSFYNTFTHCDFTPFGGVFGRREIEDVLKAQFPKP